MGESASEAAKADTDDPGVSGVRGLVAPRAGGEKS